MDKKHSYDEQSRNKLYGKKTKKSSNANGWFDKKAIRAETLASTLQRRGNPPNWALEKILDLVEEIQGRDVTSGLRGDKEKIGKALRAQEDAVKRCWDAYYIILNTQVMYPGMDTQDESWNGAKMVNGKFVSEPVSYMPTGQLESFHGALKHGDKAKGRTTPKIYSSETWGISNEE